MDNDTIGSKHTWRCDVQDSAGVAIRIKESEPAVEAVERYLESKGMVVYKPVVKIARNKSEIEECSDMGDLVVRRKIIEVKGVRLTWTGPWDYPFYPDFLVERLYTYKRKIRKYKPYVWVVVSADLRYSYWVKESTREHWGVKKLKDPNVGVADFLYCPRQHVEFRKLW